MMRKVIVDPMREGVGRKVEIVAVMLSIAILSVALLMFMVVVPSRISQSRMSQSTITAGNAGPSANVAGIWTYMNTLQKITYQADGNTLIYGKWESTWSGTFEGISHDSFTGTVYLSGSITLKGQVDFNGKVKGKVGTLVIQFLGKVIRKDELRVFGQWSISSGTGDLANLRGEGSIRGYGGYLVYSGQIYFE